MLQRRRKLRLGFHIDSKALASSLLGLVVALGASGGSRRGDAAGGWDSGCGLGVGLVCCDALLVSLPALSNFQSVVSLPFLSCAQSAAMLPSPASSMALTFVSGEMPRRVIVVGMLVPGFRGSKFKSLLFISDLLERLCPPFTSKRAGTLDRTNFMN